MTEDLGGSPKRRWSAFRLIEVPGLAVSPGAIMIASFAWLLIWLLASSIDLVIPAKKLLSESGAEAVVTGFDPFAPISSMVDQFGVLYLPIVLIADPAAGTSDQLNLLLRLFIQLVIWSLVGVILCRRAAYRFQGDDEQPLRKIFQYSLRRWTSALRSPLIPFAAAGLLALILAGCGLFGRLPLIGSGFLFLGSPILLLVGLLIAFLLVATVLSWPLMVAAVAIDDSDGFGALSRAYSGLTGRPWHFMGYFLVSLAFGEVVIVFARLFLEFGVHCVVVSLAFGGGGDSVRSAVGRPLNHIASTLLWGIVFSYFWSAATVIYLLLRLEIDGVPLNRIKADDTDRPVREPLPVVGIPATDAAIDSVVTLSSGHSADDL